MVNIQTIPKKHSTQQQNKTKQNKTTPPPKITSVGEDVEKLERLCISGRNIKWYSQYRKQHSSSSKIINRITRSSCRGAVVNESD